MELLGIDVLFKGSNAARLLDGLWVAVQISIVSVVISIVLGLLFGVFMTWKNPVAKVISSSCCCSSCSSAQRACSG